MKYLLSRGVASIPIILVFGILIIAIGVGITAMTFSEGLASQGGYQSIRALLYAEAGARDALERIARNKHYSCATTDCYSLSFATSGCSTGSACARIKVSTDAGTSINPKIITAKGVAGINVRTLQVSVIFDSGQFGQIATSTWQELNG